MIRLRMPLIDLAKTNAVAVETARATRNVTSSKVGNMAGAAPSDDVQLPLQFGLLR